MRKEKKINENEMRRRGVVEKMVIEKREINNRWRGL